MHNDTPVLGVHNPKEVLTLSECYFLVNSCFSIILSLDECIVTKHNLIGPLFHWFSLFHILVNLLGSLEFG